MPKPAIWLAVVGLVWSALLFTPPVAADQEPNNMPAAAQQMEPGIMHGAVGAGDDEDDFYAFEVSSGHIIDLQMRPIEKGEWVTLWLLDHLQSGLLRLQPGGTLRGRWLTPAGMQDRSWYVQATGEGPYEFTLQINPQKDAGTLGDAPEDYKQALRVEPGIIGGITGDGDEWDAYTFEVRPGYTIDVRFQSLPPAPDEGPDLMYLDLRDAAEDLIEHIESYGQPTTLCAESLEIDRPQRWFIGVGKRGGYRITLRLFGPDGQQIPGQQGQPAQDEEGQPVTDEGQQEGEQLPAATGAALEVIEYIRSNPMPFLDAYHRLQPRRDEGATRYEARVAKSVTEAVGRDTDVQTETTFGVSADGHLIRIVRRGDMELCLHATRDDLVAHFEDQGVSGEAARPIGDAVYAHEMHYVRQVRYAPQLSLRRQASDARSQELNLLTEEIRSLLAWIEDNHGPCREARQIRQQLDELQAQ